MSGFFVQNFGCRASQADGAAIERQFRDRGLARASSSASAEVVVLNTCTVTEAADQDARAAIRRIRRLNPACEIIVTGCYAQRAPGQVAALPGVSRVVGNSHKHILGEIAALHSPSPAGRQTAFVPLSSLTSENQEPASGRQEPSADGQRLFVSDIFAHTELLAAPVFDASGERTRPNLKVQDGCDNRCSFCVIPSVRGHSRSLPLDETLRQIKSLVEAGYREVVISGINLGRWGRDLGAAACQTGRRPAPTRFEGLVRAILEETALEKLRLSSVEPMDWSDELIQLMASSSRIAKHAHVPMQSGSDRVLRMMHRKYRPWHYREKIEKIRAALPDAAIGADVMVGFPGESDADFEATRRLIEDLPFTYLHVFTYSRRPGTPAASMSHQVPAHTAHERNRILRELGAEKKLAFMRGFVGRTVEAITLATSNNLSSRAEHCEPQSESQCGVEGPFDKLRAGSRVPAPGTYTEALTGNYLKLRLRGRHEPNRWLTVSVTQVENGALFGVSS